MTSQAHAAEPLAGIRGLVVVALPLHPAGKPSVARADHLSAINAPMLSLQGTRDALAEMHLLAPVIERLGASARLIPGADHAFRAPARESRPGPGAMAELLDAAAAR